MFPECKARNIAAQCVARNSMRGSLLPVAMFSLVIMAILSVSLIRSTGQSSSATTLEAFSLSALYSAESGAQYAMGRLFYPEVDRSSTDGRCSAINAMSDLNFSAPGMSGCSAGFSCTQSTNAANTVSYYRITSVGHCGSGDYQASRTIQVSARLAD